MVGSLEPVRKQDKHDRHDNSGNNNDDHGDKQWRPRGALGGGCVIGFHALGIPHKVEHPAFFNRN
jgi:hypothetical protein